MNSNKKIDNEFPFMVLIKDAAQRQLFKVFLLSEGFNCKGWNDSYPGILVNMRNREFRMITRACKYACMNDRNYSNDEFMEEVFNPWKGKLRRK